MIKKNKKKLSASGACLCNQGFRLHLVFESSHSAPVLQMGDTYAGLQDLKLPLKGLPQNNMTTIFFLF